MSDDDQLPLDGLAADDALIDADGSVSARETEPLALEERDVSTEASAAKGAAAAATATTENLATVPKTPTDRQDAAGPGSGTSTGSDDGEPSGTDAAVASQAISDAMPDPTLDAKKTGDTAAVYFLTNRMNLNGILSSRLVSPRESFHKYYADLLDLAPGWVPLLAKPPNADLLDAVARERGSGFPVVVEFPATVIPRRVRKSVIAYVPALALADATAIHFREERDLKEHRARGYANVHPHDDLLRVTPALFAATEAGPTTFSPPPDPPMIDWRGIDRIRGAVNAAVVSAGSGEQLAIAAALLGADKTPSGVVIPTWLSWAEIDDHDPEGDAAGHQVPLETQAADSGPQPDRIGFRAAYTALGVRDVSEEWSPNAVLDAVETAISANSTVAPEAIDALMRNLRRVRSIVNIEVDFEPFRPSARALISAKALLLVLLRQDLQQLLEWPREETGADDLTHVVSALFAGRLRGLARESARLRILDLDDLTARWAVRAAHGSATRIGRAQIVANSRGTTVKVDGTSIATSEPLLPDLIAKYHKVPEAKKEATRINVSRAMGWLVQYRIELPPDAVVTPVDSAISVSTGHELTLTETVEEDGFLQQLGALSGTARSQATRAFSSRR